MKRNIPLNQGCLNPIKVIIPSGTLLNPTNDAAVVGGNVLTSQRVTDVVLLAFRACAASQVSRSHEPLIDTPRATNQCSVRVNRDV